MKIKFMLLGLICLSLAGCLKTKTESQNAYEMPKEELKTVSEICLKMKGQGDINTLFLKVKKDTDSILGLINNKYMAANEKIISSLANEISSDAQKIRSLSSVEWSDEKYEHSLGWNIDENDFRDLLGTRLHHFGMQDAQIQHIYLNGEERKDLASYVEIIFFDGYSAKIKYKKMASALELCQLEKTLMIVVNIDYKNLFIRDNRYFNLIVNRDENL